MPDTNHRLSDAQWKGEIAARMSQVERDIGSIKESLKGIYEKREEDGKSRAQKITSLESSLDSIKKQVSGLKGQLPKQSKELKTKLQYIEDTAEQAQSDVSIIKAKAESSLSLIGTREEDQKEWNKKAEKVMQDIAKRVEVNDKKLIQIGVIILVVNFVIVGIVAPVLVNVISAKVAAQQSNNK